MKTIAVPACCAGWNSYKKTLTKTIAVPAQLRWLEQLTKPTTTDRATKCLEQQHLETG